MTNYLERYLQGEYEQVWDELYTCGAKIRQDPLFSDALAVTQEMMKRVLENIKILIPRLHALGYSFGIYPDGDLKILGYTKPHLPPHKSIRKHLSQYRTMKGVGEFPLSLQVFWEIVGAVDLMGYHPSWPEYSDPLVVYSPEVIEIEYSNWLDYMEETGEAGPFAIPIAPDFYHKDNVSGGAPYEIKVPNYTIDAIVENERHKTTFVNYLRICFQAGGFPGIESAHREIQKEISSLSDGLIPF